MNRVTYMIFRCKLKFCVSGHTEFSVQNTVFSVPYRQILNSQITLTKTTIVPRHEPKSDKL